MLVKAYYRKTITFVILIVFFLFIIGCSSTAKKSTPVPTYTPRPSATPTNTPSPIPTYPAPTTSPAVKPIPKPIIMFPSGDISIGAVSQRTPVQVFIELGNDGDGDLSIYRIDAPDFFLCKSALPLTLAPGKTVKLEFSVDTQNARLLDSTLRFQTNDTYSPKQELQVQGYVEPVSLEVRERREQYLQIIDETQPQYLNITDLGRETSWQFVPLPAYSKKWGIKMVNNGPGNAEGIIRVLATMDGNIVNDSKTFHLISNQETMLEFTLGVDFFFSLFGKYKYKYEFSDLKEEVLKERILLDIYRINKNGEEKLDTFLKDSEKARTWKESDYYKPNPVNLMLTLQGVPNAVSNTPTPQPIQTVPSYTPTAIPIPTVTETPPAFDLQISAAPPSHSVSLTVSITIQARAKLTNTGDKDAHNIKAYIRARAKSNGQTIKTNGKDITTVDLGNLPGKQSLEKNLSLSMEVGWSTAKDLQDNGITFNIDVVSDETQKTFTYSYPP